MALKFSTLFLEVSPTFWASLASTKLDDDGLEKTERNLYAIYHPASSSQFGDSGRMFVSDLKSTYNTSFNDTYISSGKICVLNSIEELSSLDRYAVLHTAASKIWRAILSKEIYSDLTPLASFIIMCYANLKTAHFTYIYAFPALFSQSSWKIVTDSTLVSNGLAALPTEECHSLRKALDAWYPTVQIHQRGFFLLERLNRDSANFGAANEAEVSSWRVARLQDYEDNFFVNAAPRNAFVGFADPSTYPENPGWMLRNLLILIYHKWSLREVQIICFRGRSNTAALSPAHSLALHLRNEGASSHDRFEVYDEAVPQLPQFAGWRKDQHDKIMVHNLDLAALMSPSQLAEQAVDLNLKLMKWRLAPTLDLETIKNSRCLLIGAGTLGTYVARALQGWGVRNITFIDGAKVSYSNPARQCLYSHNDCQNGGAFKAIRAAEALQEINPITKAMGYVMQIPMAGHRIVDSKIAESHFLKLQRLIELNNAIFLLTDNRESRWLPTVMARAAGRLVMNAALGFDTFLAMQHGMTTGEGRQAELGCYFCNDVVGPLDSTSNRPLDQQCTVSRPGLAPMAAASLVEIFVAICQAKHSSSSSTSGDASSESNSQPLGAAPHQIRGFLRDFKTMSINSPRFENCSACSDPILHAYRTNGWDFVSKAISDTDYIEEISGLRQIHEAAELAIANFESDDNETVL